MNGDFKPRHLKINKNEKKTLKNFNLRLWLTNQITFIFMTNTMMQLIAFNVKLFLRLKIKLLVKFENNRKITSNYLMIVIQALVNSFFFDRF